jgi:predicted nucleotidyltransferase
MPYSVGMDLNTKLAQFCAGKPVTRVEIFGSRAKGMADRDSDLDLLVTYGEGTPTGLGYFEFVAQMRQQLELLLECSVDLVDRETVEKTMNPILRNSILSGSRPVYERSR